MRRSIPVRLLIGCIVLVVLSQPSCKVHQYSSVKDRDKPRMIKVGDTFDVTWTSTRLSDTAVSVYLALERCAKALIIRDDDGLYCTLLECGGSDKEMCEMPHDADWLPLYEDQWVVCVDDESLMCWFVFLCDSRKVSSIIGPCRFADVIRALDQCSLAQRQ